MIPSNSISEMAQLKNRDEFFYTQTKYTYNQLNFNQINPYSNAISIQGITIYKKSASILIALV